MSYSVSVPVFNIHFQRAGKERMVEQLHRVGARRVFLALEVYDGGGETSRKDLQALAENTAYLKAQGFQVGAWTWALWRAGEHSYTPIRLTDGRDSAQSVCPSDEAYRRSMASYLQKIARCGVDTILLDDDYRYGFLDGGFGCVCPNHAAHMERLLGEKLPEDWVQKIVSGPENPVRTAWIRANRHFLLTFARELRHALDEVDPTVRLGVCACMSVWDQDGASPLELSKALAGERTRPLLRLCGAPYWARHNSWGNRVQDTVELERMQSAWCAGEGVELLTEGDVYPRPRIHCPASYLECFDTALRADGQTDGILKYVLDYCSGADYETGYVDKHVANAAFYAGLDSLFAGREAVGVRVYETMRKVEHMDVPGGFSLNDAFFPVAARMLACHAIPTVYAGAGLCGAAFGENAKYLPQSALGNGLILDVRAAMLLAARGVDVGLRRVGEELPYTGEYYVNQDEYVEVYKKAPPPTAHHLTLAEGAQVESRFTGGAEEPVASYRYENGAGQRFLVLNFDGCFVREELYRHYTRQRQLIDGVSWLAGQALPAVIAKHPDLYMLCKEREGGLTVGLWNIFADSVDRPVVTLAREYRYIRALGCTAVLRGAQAELSPLPAFGFAAFEVSDRPFE